MEEVVTIHSARGDSKKASELERKEQSNDKQSYVSKELEQIAKQVFTGERQAVVAAQAAFTAFCYWAKTLQPKYFSFCFADQSAA